MYFMTHTYSIDFRERVVEYVSVGGDRGDACDLFKIGIATLQRWITLAKKTGGDLSAKPMGSRAWKLDHDAVVEYAVINVDATLHEIADHFSTGKSAIDYILKKRKITRKKNHAIRRARRRKAGKF
jgi:transposase